jgi:hypothetical protein
VTAAQALDQAVVDGELTHDDAWWLADQAEYDAWLDAYAPAPAPAWGELVVAARARAIRAADAYYARTRRAA